MLVVALFAGLVAGAELGEEGLLGVLEGKGTVEEKVAACEKLRKGASERAVPVLVKLTRDEAKPLRDAAVRTLAGCGQIAAAEPLLGLAKESGEPLHRALALRGYLQLARTAKLEMGERAKMLERIAPAASAPAEVRLLLSAAAEVHDPLSLKLVADQLGGEAKQEAAMAAVKLAEALWRTDGRLVRETLLRAIPLLTDEELRRQAEALAQKSSNLAALLTPAAGGMGAAIDGDAKTYWMGEGGQAEYRLSFRFDRPREIGGISITGFAHHDRAPRDLQIWVDGKMVKNLKNAIYIDNLLWEETPGVRAESIEIRIGRWYGDAPAIREIGLAEGAAPTP